jgi:hypothetical protein
MSYCVTFSQLTEAAIVEAMMTPAKKDQRRWTISIPMQTIPDMQSQSKQRQARVMCYLLMMKSFAKAAMIRSFLFMAGILDSADQNERVVFWPWTLKNSDNVYWDKSTIFETLPQGTGALVSQW